MPNPKAKRYIVLQSSTSSATASQLEVTMDASFTTSFGTTNKFEDVSANASEEKTKYRMKFANAAGGDIGCLTLRLVGKGDPQAGVTVTKTEARSDLDPTPVSGGVTLIENPAASFERIWKQKTLDSGEAEVVDNVVKLDMRVSAASGVTAVQTVQTQGSNQLVIAYSWNGPAGPLVSGTVTLDTAVRAETDYQTGKIRITDNNPTTGEERHR